MPRPAGVRNSYHQTHDEDDKAPRNQQAFRSTIDETSHVERREEVHVPRRLLVDRPRSLYEHRGEGLMEPTVPLGVSHEYEDEEESREMRGGQLIPPQAAHPLREHLRRGFSEHVEPGAQPPNA